MRIKSIELKNFKRFTDLRIDHIPESAKLVLLIGSNGSGKSSVFDAFELANSHSSYTDREYYKKNFEAMQNINSARRGLKSIEKLLHEFPIALNDEDAFIIKPTIRHKHHHGMNQ